jgi:hypothetical protein
MRTLKKMTKMEAMDAFINNLESRGIPLTLFIGRIRGIEMSLDRTTSLHIDNGIVSFGGKEAWLFYFAQLQVLNKGGVSVFGHPDFKQPTTVKG